MNMMHAFTNGTAGLKIKDAGLKIQMIRDAGLKIRDAGLKKIRDAGLKTAN
mgnify:CR=1 FL=1